MSTMKFKLADKMATMLFCCSFMQTFANTVKWQDVLNHAILWKNNTHNQVTWHIHTYNNFI